MLVDYALTHLARDETLEPGYVERAVELAQNRLIEAHGEFVAYEVNLKQAVADTAQQWEELKTRWAGRIDPYAEEGLLYDVQFPLSRPVEPPPKKKRKRKKNEA
jgi:hypothetical protein